ncbi:MAG: cytochrome c biogenesis protein CcsA [Phycisphaerae bacterium]|nr:cytochrome c biogenesis protein CcsA [Phycisphaerae bacterium]
MTGLPIQERHVFLTVSAIYLVCSILAIIQMFRSNDKFRTILISLVALGVSLESLLLVFRAVAIKGIPLTGLFESMVVLTIAFGLTFLFLSVTIHHVWFSSVMVWFIFFLTVLSAFVASPASKIELLAETPWVVWHGLSMVLSGTAIAFSGCMAGLFLLTRRNLKLKKISRVIGKVPNIEKLASLNVIGIKASFVFLSFGLMSGIGLAIVKSAEISVSFLDWITDSKMILVVVAWLLLAFILVLRHLVLRGRGVAIITLVACFLIIFSIIGASVFCGSEHDFSDKSAETVNTGGR